MPKGKGMDIKQHVDNINTVTDYRYTYVIAEIGINHNGNLETALDLIDWSAQAGVDAVKFQRRTLEEIYTKKILDDPNSAEWNFEYIIPILKDTQLEDFELEKCQDYAKSLGLDFIVTPFDEKSAKIIEPLVDAFKIGSMDMVNKPLLKTCGDYGKPLIISTGMWELHEIIQINYFLDKNDIEHFLLLANSTYPTPYESINLEVLNSLERINRSFIGYSGHERGTFIPIAAAAMGARIIEKHITLDRNQLGPDHKASMYPNEFKEMVDNLRNLEKASGKYKKINQAEKLAKQTFAKSAYVKEDLKIGHQLNIDDVYFASPGKGIMIHEIDNYYGKLLTTEVKKDTYLTKSNFEEIIPINKWNLPKFSKDWGVKTRFHDFDEYSKLNPPVIEFHMSQADLDINFNKHSNSRLIVHAPEIFDKKLVDICSNNSTHVNESIQILQKAIDKTIDIGRGFNRGRPKFVVHLGGMTLDDVKENNRDGARYAMLSRSIDAFKKLKYNPDDIEILPENLPPRPWYFGGQFFQYGFMYAEDMLKFCDYFDLNMTLDVCHAALYCNYKNISLDGYVKKVLDKSSHFHFSDAIGIDGEGVQIGEGNIDFFTLFDIIKNKKENFSWVTEIWSGHINHGKGCRESMHSLGTFNNII